MTSRAAASTGCIEALRRLMAVASSSRPRTTLATSRGENIIVNNNTNDEIVHEGCLGMFYDSVATFKSPTRNSGAGSEEPTDAL